LVQILEWRYQGNALIELFRSMYVFGKWTINGHVGHLIKRGATPEIVLSDALTS
jgi:hypothetical protein